MVSDDELKFLKRAGCSESVIQHSIAVAVKAVEVAGRVTVSVDHSLVKVGAVNHDIGRSRTHGLDHGLAGAEIVAGFGLDERIVRIIERHVGAGITMDEALTLGFPAKSYIPETPEEIIVSYADNLISHVTEISFEAALVKFESILGPSHPGIQLFIQMHERVCLWMRGCNSFK